ncbi:MAG: hypothetical protein Q8P46_06755 [Hyphomicrobiales bacterium]|nr:hypothetical protein [Hyphomicrobiales bacterium]
MPRTAREDTRLIREAAKMAAEAAVDRVLLRLGIDPQVPAEFIEVRKDLSYLRSLRQTRDAIGKTGIRTIVSVVVVGALAMLWAAFKWKLGQ